MNYLFRIQKYIHERFSIRKHLPLISVFTLSAICFSLMADDQTTFIGWVNFLEALCITFGIFLLLRISDEHKDYKDDVRYRPYLPVARGMITLKELRLLAFAILFVHITILAISPAYLWVYILAVGYMSLMYYEFFVANWLKQNQVAYVLSHMLIIPLVDLLASSAHWSHTTGKPPWQLALFFVVSFFNGIILEIGRKIRIPDREEENVVTYSALWGIKKAIVIWSLTLLMTFAFAILSAWSIQSPGWVYIVLLLLLLVCLGIGSFTWIRPSQKSSQSIEQASGIWTLGMYLNLGALPFILEHLL